MCISYDFESHFNFLKYFRKFHLIYKWHKFYRQQATKDIYLTKR